MGNGRLRRPLVLVFAILVAACSSSPSASVATPEDTAMAGFVLESPTFVEGGAIPVKNTCDGQDVSPALVWEGAHHRSGAHRR